MKQKLLALSILIILLSVTAYAGKIFIPMDDKGQTNHLKAYGVAYTLMQNGIKVEWLLNYQGGSFVMDDDPLVEQLCKQRGVSCWKITNKKYAQISKEITSSKFNGAIVKLEKPPKIAVYTPANKMPWDDAVTLALTYAEIPFDKLYANEVLAGDLDKYDWLHLHHEDFTGQYGKFWGAFRNAQWYQDDKRNMEALAAKNGYKKVSQMQLAVVKKMRDFVNSGGNLFAMCSATETFDIALAADGVDICDTEFDGDPIDYNAIQKLDFSKCFAFRDFRISINPYEYARSNIDNTYYRSAPEQLDYFTLVSSPAKMDIVPVMLCQNHVKEIQGFMGQTTAFRKEVIKPNVMVLADRVQGGIKQDASGNMIKENAYLQDYEARYIHGEYGKGSWTFLGGHDPEAYQHHVGDPVTDLSKYPNSPGYRLILNNVLFPAAKKNVVPMVEIRNAEHKNDAPAAVSDVAPVNNIKIYPNPANNELIVSTTGGKILQVTIVNIGGQEVVSRTFDSEKVSIDIKNFAAGMYMIKVNGE
jgi:hypothetical protein